MPNGFMSMRDPPTERAALSSPARHGDGALEDLFDADVFARQAALAVERLADHLADDSVRGLALTDPTRLLAAAADLTRGGRADDAAGHDQKLADIIDLYARSGIQVYSPGYMGRQFSGPFPVMAVMDMVSAIATQPASFYEAGPLPSVAERIMGEELNRFLGFPADSFAMVTTSGGSLANMTALLAARNRRYPAAWRAGAHQQTGLRPAIAASEEAHYSITRAAGIIGVGEDQVVRLPLDDARRIDPAAARRALDDAAARGLDVFCLVANAGSTAVGAIDPLNALADIAAERGIWLHVDGAHGAALMVSDRLRPRLAGIERADSLTLDAHKTLFTPAACTLLFYRDKTAAAGAFRQEASYVFDKTPDVYSAFDAAERNFECTKRPMIMALWTPWALYGPKPFADKLERLCAMTEQAHAMLTAAPDFAPLHQPDANILCFRHQPAGVTDPAALGRLQDEIRLRVRARGRFFISKVDIDGLAALRLVVMNHRVGAEHVAQLLDEIRAVAAAVIAEQSHRQEPTP